MVRSCLASSSCNSDGFVLGQHKHALLAGTVKPAARIFRRQRFRSHPHSRRCSSAHSPITSLKVSGPLWAGENGSYPASGHRGRSHGQKRLIRGAGRLRFFQVDKYDLAGSPHGSGPPICDGKRIARAGKSSLPLLKQSRGCRRVGDSERRFIRLGAASIIVVALGAIFVVRLPHGFYIGRGGIEYALTQLLIAIALLITGAGAYSRGSC